MKTAGPKEFAPFRGLVWRAGTVASGFRISELLCDRPKSLEIPRDSEARVWVGHIVNNAAG